MKIGYPCINWTIGCKGNRTFRLKNYTETRLIETVQNNLECLLEVLRFNAQHNILFFRITSDLVSFASHPICTFDWQGYFEDQFKEIGEFIRNTGIRISMHPDQFIVLNAEDEGVVARSTKELLYHVQVLDVMALDETAKIQIHIGGVYGDKEKSLRRFIARYAHLDKTIKKRLVIENDDKRYTLRDCLTVNAETGIPVLFDTFHHHLNSSGERSGEAIAHTTKTWKLTDGVPMVDYSLQNRGDRTGRHAESIDLQDFSLFLEATKPLDFDIMLEIKDKEQSALKAVEAASRDGRFIKAS